MPPAAMCAVPKLGIGLPRKTRCKLFSCTRTSCEQPWVSLRACNLPRDKAHRHLLLTSAPGVCRLLLSELLGNSLEEDL